MNNKRPLILISNDDGYQAKGINSLVDMLRDMCDILVCAPDSARSGFATAFTSSVPLRRVSGEKSASAAKSQSENPMEGTYFMQPSMTMPIVPL